MGNKIPTFRFPNKSFDKELVNLFNEDNLLDILNQYYIPDLFGMVGNNIEYDVWCVDIGSETYYRYSGNNKSTKSQNNAVVFENGKILNLNTMSNIKPEEKMYDNINRFTIYNNLKSTTIYRWNNIMIIFINGCLLGVIYTRHMHVMANTINVGFFKLTNTHVLYGDTAGKLYKYDILTMLESDYDGDISEFTNKTISSTDGKNIIVFNSGIVNIVGMTNKNLDHSITICEFGDILTLSGYKNTTIIQNNKKITIDRDLDFN